MSRHGANGISDLSGSNISGLFYFWAVSIAAHSMGIVHL